MEIISQNTGKKYKEMKILSKKKNYLEDISRRKIYVNYLYSRKRKNKSWRINPI